MKFKKILRLALAAMIVAPMIFNTAVPRAQAVEIQNDEFSIISIDDLLRYTYISRISAGLVIDGNTAYCDGSYSAYDDYEAEFYILLQRSQNQVKWTDIQKWYGTFDGAGPHLISGDRRITQGYAYRVIAHVEIGGKSAESISPIKQT